jgi:hypothetical protein
VKAFFRGKEIDGAKSAIDSAGQKDKDSMGYLTATMTAELLHHDKGERREQILTWLWSGDYWKRHQYFQSQRVPNTGDWFLNSEAFTKWKTGTGSGLLISLGIRTFSLHAGLPAIHPRIPGGILGKSRIAEIPTSDDRFKSPKGGRNSGAEFYTGHSPIPRELS